MSLKKYEAFVMTAKLGSLTKAADALGTTQSRISHILHDMESDYGFMLMQRGRGGVQLTEAGKRLLPLMQEILEKNACLEAAIVDIRKADSETLRLGTFSSVSVHWLPGMLQQFQAAHPNVQVQIMSGDYHDIDQWLRSEEIDLGFLALPAPENKKVIALKEDPLVAILPKLHPLAARQTVSIQELAQEPFISLLQTSNHDIYRALNKAGIHPKIRYSTKDDYALIAMVEQGLGISIVPELLITDRRNDVAIRPLDPPASRTIALAFGKEQPMPAVTAFAETAIAWIRENLKNT